MSSFLGWLLMRISISPMPPVTPHSVAVTVAFLVLILNLGTIGAGGGGGGGAGGGGEGGHHGPGHPQAVRGHFKEQAHCETSSTTN